MAKSFLDTIVKKYHLVELKCANNFLILIQFIYLFSKALSQGKPEMSTNRDVTRQGIETDERSGLTKTEMKD